LEEKMLYGHAYYLRLSYFFSCSLLNSIIILGTLSLKALSIYGASELK
jgi:hypothetical protein